MKLQNISLLISITALLLFSRENIFPTGSFEYYDPAWKISLQDSVDSSAVSSSFQSSEAAFTGSYGARIKVFEGQPEDWYIQLKLPTWTCENNLLYRFSMDARGTNPVQVSISYRRDWSYKEGFTFDLREDYAHYSGNFSSDISGQDSLVITIDMGKSPGTYDLDNISVQVIDTLDNTNSWYLKADDRIDSLRKTDITLHLQDSEGASLSGLQARAQLVRHSFPFGTALNLDTTTSDDQWYRETAADLFNEVVTENAFKWVDYEPSPGEIDTQSIQEYIAYADSNGLSLRGHVLMWGLQEYGFESHWPNNLNARELTAAVQERITRDLTLFKGSVDDYDVWNEPFHEPTFFKKTRQLYPDNYWALMDSAFIWARRADPEAALYLNEYSVIAGGQTETLYDLVAGMQERGVPIDGIGVQCHFGNNRIYPDLIRHRLDKLDSLGIDIKITEFDMGTRDTGVPLSETEQAAEYARFIRTAFSHPAVDGILLWGFWDKIQWIGPTDSTTGAGLFRPDKSPKPAADSLSRLWKKDWHTDTSLTLNSNSEISFRGFKGTYRISLEKDGGRIWAECTLSDSLHKQTLRLSDTGNTPILATTDASTGLSDVTVQNGQIHFTGPLPREVSLYTPKGRRAGRITPTQRICSIRDIAFVPAGTYIMESKYSNFKKEQIFIKKE
ncbi:MAG: endo-1,4-beta-xylanase [Fibrobacterota bacterium]